MVPMRRVYAPEVVDLGGYDNSTGGSSSRNTSDDSSSGSRNDGSRSGNHGQASSSQNGGNNSDSAGSYSYDSVSSLSASLPSELNAEVGWGGLAPRGYRCHHDTLVVASMATLIEEDGNQCHYVKWRDPPYNKRMQRFIKDLWFLGTAAARSHAKAMDEKRVAVAERNRLMVLVCKMMGTNATLEKEKAEEMTKAKEAVVASMCYQRQATYAMMVAIIVMALMMFAFLMMARYK